MWHTCTHVSHYHHHHHHHHPLWPCTDSSGLSASPMTRPNTRNVHSLWTRIVCNLPTETSYPHKLFTVSAQALVQTKVPKPPTKSHQSIGPIKSQKVVKKTLSGPLKLWWLNKVVWEFESLYTIPCPWSIMNLPSTMPNGANNYSGNPIHNGSSWVNFRYPSPACGLWAQHLALEEVKDILGRIFASLQLISSATPQTNGHGPVMLDMCRPYQTPAWIGFVTWSKCVKRYLAKQEAAINM